MSLLDPHFIRFDGDSINGRIPLNLRLHSAVPGEPVVLDRQQTASVRATYFTFCRDRIASPHTGHFFRQGSWRDGTRWTIWSLQGMDIMDVWLPATPPTVSHYSGLAYAPFARHRENDNAQDYTFTAPFGRFSPYGTKFLAGPFSPPQADGPYLSPHRVVRRRQKDDAHRDAVRGIMERYGYYWVRERLLDGELVDDEEVYSGGNIVYFDNTPVAALNYTYGFVVHGKFVFSLEWDGVYAAPLKLPPRDAPVPSGLKVEGGVILAPARFEAPVLVLATNLFPDDLTDLTDLFCPSPDGTKFVANSVRGARAEFGVSVNVFGEPEAVLLDSASHERAEGVATVVKVTGIRTPVAISSAALSAIDGLRGAFSPPGEPFTLEGNPTIYITSDIAENEDHLSRTDTMSKTLSDEFVIASYYTAENERRDVTFTREFSLDFVVHGSRGIKVLTQAWPTPTGKDSYYQNFTEPISDMGHIMDARRWNTEFRRYSGVALAKSTRVHTEVPYTLIDVRSIEWGDETMEVFRHETHYAFDQRQDTAWSDLEEGQERLGRYLVSDGSCTISYSSETTRKEFYFFDPTRDIFIWEEYSDRIERVPGDLPLYDLSANPFGPESFGAIASHNLANNTPLFGDPLPEYLLDPYDTLPDPGLLIGLGVVAPFTFNFSTKRELVVKIRGREYRRVLEDQTSSADLPASGGPGEPIWENRSFRSGAAVAPIDMGVLLMAYETHIPPVEIIPNLFTYQGRSDSVAFRIAPPDEPGGPTVLELIAELGGVQITERGFEDWLSSTGFPEEAEFLRTAQCFRVGKRKP